MPTFPPIREVLRRAPVIPVMVIERLDDAVPLAQALVAGGIRVLEITLRTPVALAAIEAIARAVPAATVGAGTLTRPTQFAQVRDAGAVFAVTPGLTGTLHSAAQEAAMPLLPGVMTPSEIIAAQNLGIDTLKLFPAEQAGGVGMLKALGGPFPELRFCPTGGIRPDHARDYLALPNVLCVGGSWLTPPALLAQRDWAAITQRAAEAAALPRTA